MTEISDKSSNDLYTTESDDYEPENKDLLNERYQIIKKIGAGAFSTVWKCIDTYTSKFVAIKIQKTTNECLNSIHREIDILEELRKHNVPYIAHIISKFIYYTTIGNKHYCMVLELYDMDLVPLIPQSIKNQKLFDIKRYIKQICTGLHSMHKLQIIHTDIKPENILLKEENIYISDFSTSDWIYSISSGIVGTRYYRAPEIILGLNITMAVDIWSVGIMLIELLTGCLILQPTISEKHIPWRYIFIKNIVEIFGHIPKWMYRGFHVNKLFKKNRSIRNIDTIVYRPFMQYMRDRFNIVDTELITLLKGMMSIDPNTRYTADMCLNSKWLLI
jgi:serine/threonine protein kinase